MICQAPVVRASNRLNTSRPVHDSPVRDMLANFVGKGSVATLALVSTPIFLRHFGIDSYAVIAFFLTLQSVAMLLDLGFGMTLNRMLAAARGKSVPYTVVAMATKLDRFFLGGAFVLGGAGALIAPSFATGWLRLEPGAIPHSTAAFSLMAVAIALQLPFMLYSGGLAGLGRQTHLNTILATCAFLKYGGAVVVAVFYPRLDAFFVWQTAANFFQSAWARRAFRRHLGDLRPGDEGDVPHLRQQLGFALGVGGTAALGVVLTQLDKLLLSRLLSLSDFGLYMMAWVLSSGLFMFALPVTAAFFPRLTAAVNSSARNEQDIFRLASQFMAVSVFPVAALLIVFPEHVLLLWTGDLTLAQQASPLVSLLTLGMLLNVLSQVPHALLLAHGKSRLGMIANALLVMAVVPALVFGVRWAGVDGAAWVWVALNAAYATIAVPMILKWLLPGNFQRWALGSAIAPGALALIAPLLLSYFSIVPLQRSVSSSAMLVACYLGSVLICAVSLKDIRGIIFQLLHSRSYPMRHISGK